MHNILILIYFASGKAKKKQVVLKEEDRLKNFDSVNH